MPDDFALGLAAAEAGFYGDKSTSWFPDPFFSVASLAIPQNIPAALRTCEFILLSNGVYRAAIGRNISYFLTSIDIKGEDISDDEKQDFKGYLEDELHILEHCYHERLNEACYGNSFTSVIESFTRYFICKKCHLEVTFDTMTQYGGFQHQWSSFQMTGTCPKCDYRGPWTMHDRRGGKDGDLIIKHWSPHEIQILWDPYSHRTAYVWMIPEDFRRFIIEGKPHVLKYAPKEVIEAVRTNTYIRFGDNEIFHGMTRTFAGMRNRGWGISRVLTNFRQVYYCQVLHRFNEAIALDYVMPIRMITPDGRQGATPESSDPLLSVPMTNYSSQIEQMVRDHRRDPASIHWFPMPIKYQALGGEASQMAPFELLDQGLDALLNSCDIPVELYKMNLGLQESQPALRLYESVHRATSHNVNRFLRFVMEKVGHFKDWPSAEAALTPVTLIDDLSKQMPKLQLMSAGQVSPQTGMATIGLDAKEEYEKTIDFQRFQQETQEETEKELQEAGIQQQIGTPPVMQMAAQQQQGQGDPSQGGAAGGAQGGAGGAPPPSAQGGAAGGFAAQQPVQNDMPTDPREVLARAQNIAAQLLPLTEGERASRLKQMKQQQPLLHDAVTDALKDIRTQASSQGRDQVLQQQFGKAGSGVLRLKTIITPDELF